MEEEAKEVEKVHFFAMKRFLSVNSGLDVQSCFLARAPTVLLLLPKLLILLLLLLPMPATITLTMTSWLFLDFPRCIDGSFNDVFLLDIFVDFLAIPFSRRDIFTWLLVQLSIL